MSDKSKVQYLGKGWEQAEQLRQRAVNLEVERDTAWAELRDICRLIEADEHEATIDEVQRVVHQRDDLRRHLDETTNALNAANSQCAEMARQLDQAQARTMDLAGQLAEIAIRNPGLIKVEIAEV